jgi:hypothetical protein
MAWTTGRTTAQMAAVLVTAGALSDQAVNALHSGAWKPGQVQTLWGVLIQCTSGWNNPGDAVWEYNTAPAFANTAKTLAQTAAVLVTAGAIFDQAVNALHSLAWVPGKPFTLWGVLVECTAGWNTSAGAPVFEYTVAPS